MSGSYQIDDKPIATGGQGAVYFGTDPKGRKIAVKVAAKSEIAEQALDRELEIVRHMNDAGVKGVVPCVAELRIRGRKAMVMPRYPEHMGDWLKRSILEPGPHTLRELLDYHAKLARVLGAVHKVYYDGGTVVHRDVKPENIFLDGKGGLFLGDFGGAMAIEELKAMELAMFGTPMWAPLDQLLPGRAMPDTTWDTYATCVLLYAAVTGARPAYQADPRELLTPAGQALWQAARSAVEAQGDSRGDAQRRFAVMRKGTRGEDLVDLTGRAALVNGDREALRTGLARLCKLAGMDERVEKALDRGLWNLLVRGLSPLSHPSPPNRYRDAEELAETIEDLMALLEEQAKPRAKPQNNDLADLLGGGVDLDVQDEPRERRTTLSAGPPVLLAGIGVVLVVGLVVGTWFLWPTLVMAFNAGRSLAPTVEVSGGSVALPAGVSSVQDFALDTTEVSQADYQACVDAGRCEALAFRNGPEHPAAGLGYADAQAVCDFRGGRVPSEAQWTRAHGEATFPWGDDAPTCDRAVALGCGSDLGTVGSGRQGASPFGAIDMAGNVWEWAAGVDGPVLRGGDMTSPPKELGVAGRKMVPEGTRPSLAGVRCAYPAGGGPGR
ncbi:MAG: SUMF1/EgtB/PvdO family nonheme iron enzyme [Alphaproteobacteria bacterium]|nr:SUMF1/EgtB/PvdO family nonheme iron enzyme [Alphaproteobacteria bacterium]